MKWFGIALLLASEALSVFLIYRLLSRGRLDFEKIALCVVLLVPVLGPLLYAFLSENVPPQRPWQKNTGPRGYYTDMMIAMRAVLSSRNDERSQPDARVEVRKESDERDSGDRP